MEIRDNVGAVKTILSAVPAVEERRVFNGNARRNFEPCSANGAEANAVIFYAENGVGFHDCTAQFAICNLTSDSVDYILTELLQKGAADLSAFKYQPKKDFDEKYIFDNGKSGAYWSNMAIFPRFPQPPFGMQCSMMQDAIVQEAEDGFTMRQEDEDEDYASAGGYVVPSSYRKKAMSASSNKEDECSREDLSILSDEGLRLTIYGLGEYTFKELAEMSREELEEEYENLEVKAE